MNNNKKILTKKDIEDLVCEIYACLKLYEMNDDVCIYYNNKRLSTYGNEINFEENIHADDYCEYAPWDNIVTISSEGPLYDYVYEYGMPTDLDEIFEKYGLYYETNESWNWSLYPINDDMKIEYPEREPKPKDPEYIWLGKENVDKRLDNIMQWWYDKGHEEGDVGCCVIGAHMKFTLDGVRYEMAPSTGWQGEGSWTPFVDDIKTMLENIGATNISWRCGILD